MKKVLVVANLFHASPRIPGLAKYVAEFGWLPIVLTPPLGENPDSQFGPPNDFREKNTVIETYGFDTTKDLGLRMRKLYKSTSRRSLRYAEPVLKFLFRRYSEMIHYPDREKDWVPFAAKAGDELLSKESVDAMISTSPLPTTHIVAKQLKSKHKLPWVADFRDLWTLNDNYPYSILRKLFERRLELKTLAMADAFVTVSAPLTEKMGRLHKGRKMYTITNGFDPEKMNDGKTDLTPNFTITFTGQIYTGKRDPSKLFIALKELISQGIISRSNVEVRFYGPENDLLTQAIEEHSLSDVVKCYGVVSREESLIKQRESHVLLQLNWEDPHEKGVYTGKIFEYLAAQRPILVTGGFGNDVTEALLKETNSGMYCPTVEDTKNALKKMYTEYQSKGKVAYRGNLETINKYSYREMAKKFAEIMDDLVSIRQCA